MRKILFRAKAINRDPDGNYRTSYQNGDWVYGLLTALPDEHFGFPAKMRNVAGISGIEVDYKTLGQYTGLDDKNGVPIFEGDIVKIDGIGEIIGTNELVVEFEMGAFYLCHNDRLMYLLRNWHDCIEVIGNLYDNPELFEEGDTK